MKTSKQYRITLRTKAPLFIGSGSIYSKKEYLYNKDDKKVTIINQAKLMRWIVSCGLDVQDKYERFMLEDNIHLREFFRSVKINASEQRRMYLYETDAGAAVDDNGTLKKINAFMRDAYNRPFVPGSSLKGALRTAILIKMIRDDNCPQQLPEDISKEYSAQRFEEHYLHTLAKPGIKKYNALNSVMSGVSISDSIPLEQRCMILAKKIDKFRNGGENSNRLNVVRECVKPGVDITFSLLIKPEISGKITAQYITEAVREYGEYYKTAYSDKFSYSSNTPLETFEDCIVLGGGAGYFGKNIVYPGRPWENALKRVSKMMAKKFQRHRHERDETIGISPRAIKYTEYKITPATCPIKYQFGVCHISIDGVE